jgi:hypothetical protein
LAVTGNAKDSSALARHLLVLGRAYMIEVAPRDTLAVRAEFQKQIC